MFQLLHHLAGISTDPVHLQAKLPFHRLEKPRSKKKVYRNHGPFAEPQNGRNSERKPSLLLFSCHILSTFVGRQDQTALTLDPVRTSITRSLRWRAWKHLKILSEEEIREEQSKIIRCILDMGVFISGGSPKWMVYSEKSHLKWWIIQRFRHDLGNLRIG